MTASMIDVMTTTRHLLGENSRQYLSDDRLAMMVMMTGGSHYDTFKMAVGYILQTLDLHVHNRPTDADEYRHEMTYYQDLLNKSLVHLAA